jgi:hypothetical protein
MEAEKSVGLTFRVTPHTKRLLVAAAEHERRSLTNMLEVLIAEYCERAGIGGGNASHPKGAARPTKKATAPGTRAE